HCRGKISARGLQTATGAERCPSCPGRGGSCGHASALRQCSARSHADRHWPRHGGHGLEFDGTAGGGKCRAKVTAGTDWGEHIALMLYYLNRGNRDPNSVQSSAATSGAEHLCQVDARRQLGPKPCFPESQWRQLDPDPIRRAGSSLSFGADVAVGHRPESPDHRRKFDDGGRQSREARSGPPAELSGGQARLDRGADSQGQDPAARYLPQARRRHCSVPQCAWPRRAGAPGGSLPEAGETAKLLRLTYFGDPESFFNVKASYPYWIQE